MAERKVIRQLPPNLVNRIAAGEVIERPASAVKELVENAIDAGATFIQVDVEEGGLSLIRVIDNGVGIPPEELPLAFAAHATSKLTSDEDLERIRTMGFRGEALASIGSVSQARILSRTPGSDAAYELRNVGGELSAVVAASGSVGTTVEARNLFYNVPARRKFLRGASTEYGHVSEMVLRLAVPHGGVGFRLTHNGRTTLDLAATDAQSRWLAAWPAEFAEQRLPIEVSDGPLVIRGVIGLPELARPTQRYQYVYLNGRMIRDKFVTHGLREAYRGLTEPGRHPAAVLLIEMPPGDVDVNVHPTKSEVRYRDSGRVHGLLMNGVRERLLGSDLSPHATVRMTAGGGGGEAAAEQAVAPRPDMRARLAEFFAAPAAGEAPRLPIGPAVVEESREVVAMPVREEARPAATSPTWGVGEASGAVRAIQLHNTYLVVEEAEGLQIIDQHALHERIQYEDLLARLTRGPLESQPLLIPLTLTASAAQVDVIERIAPMLRRLGIEAERFGPGSIAIRAFPSFLEKLDPVGFMADLLERGEQELLDMHDEGLLHGVLDMMACKSAVKAGDPLTQGEIAALLSRRDLVDRASNCPHGRPTTLRLTLRDLEKQFKRTGF